MRLSSKMRAPERSRHSIGARMQPEKQASSKGSTIGLALLFGVVGASVASDIEGFLFGAMFGGLLAQVFHLRGRIQSLQEQLQSLRLSVDLGEPKPRVRPSPLQAERTPPPADVTPAAVTEPGAAADQAASAVPPLPVRETLAAASRAEVREDVAPAPPPPPRRPPTPLAPDAFDRLIGQFMSWLKRGNPLARVGIVILFFGATFLAKYAAENSLFPIEFRFVAIALGAFALLIVGWRLRDKRAVYAQLLQGGGIAGLYLTVFAATKFELLPTGLAFGLLVIIALAAAILAVGQNALSLAVIGTAGGFLAPIMVSTGSGNYIALFSYYAILNLEIGRAHV